MSPCAPCFQNLRAAAARERAITPLLKPLGSRRNGYASRNQWQPNRIGAQLCLVNNHSQPWTFRNTQEASLELNSRFFNDVIREPL
mmetsp:Transcript_99273/g.212692  ORF Transcript_99273/g.212692 Transcript_99273/m.212692 type:complete len:86 (+) Transcript_99273:15-272(+)